MFYSRFILAVLSLFAIILPILAAPVVTEAPAVNGTDVSETHLEKRITHNGKGSWFNVGLGNCGWNSVDTDYVLAISYTLYHNNKGSNCGQYVKITNKANGKSVYAKTVDSCPGCGYDDLDLSPAVFKKISSLDKGIIQVSWSFQAKGFKPRSE